MTTNKILFILLILSGIGQTPFAPQVQVSSRILSIVTYLYLLTGLLYISAWIFKNRRLYKPASWLAVISVSANLGGIILRWIESYQMGAGHAPFANMYESLVFFAFVIAVLYLYLEFKYDMRIVGAFAFPMAFLAMAYSSLVNDRIEPLIPALQSDWLIAHVITCFLGYAGFAVSFAVSIMYLIKSREVSGSPGQIASHLPEPGVLDELTHQLVMFGFLFLTIGIITGSVWAKSAWGNYWSWDPKETWSLITWIVYAVLLHARLMRGWSGKRIAWISIVGFISVMFTFFGVNYLLTGLHSYAG